MTRTDVVASWSLLLSTVAVASCRSPEPDFQARFAATVDPTTTLWYTHPAEDWDNALPVGNGRLGAMVFGKTDEERIHFNEETYWTGGPYSSTVKGGFEALPRIQAHVFAGEYLKAHNLFGRHLMGYPVEQMKYQSLGDLILRLEPRGAVADYVHELDLDRAIATVQYEQGGILRLLGTPVEHKRHVLLESAHTIPRSEGIKETLDWLDRYLGPVGS
jgi:hypothetical protein